MAKPQIVKCRYCKKEIEKATAYKPSSSSTMYYCNEECYKKAQQKKSKSNKPRNNGRYKAVEGTERYALTEYIQSLYLRVGFTKQNINWAMIGSQIKDFTTNDKYKYTGIKYTLWYMMNIKRMNLFNEGFNGSILNLVPYYYIEAKEYYKKKMDVKKAVKEFEFNDENKVIDITQELQLDMINLEEIE